MVHTVCLPSTHATHRCFPSSDFLSPRPPRIVRCQAHQRPEACLHVPSKPKTCALDPSRRDILAALTVLPAIFAPVLPACAIQGTTAGRIPGLSKEPDEAGNYLYSRPEGKSGGHGVGWSEIPVYQFKVPAGWQETPVSIADLGGTEIDLRFSSSQQGELAVVVAPVLRFRDVGFNADVRIEEIASPDVIIAGFAPELFGAPLNDEDVVDTQVSRTDGLTYYSWELKGHKLVTATALKNRLFIMTVAAKTAQWRKHADKLRNIRDSFKVLQV